MSCDSIHGLILSANTSRAKNKEKEGKAAEIFDIEGTICWNIEGKRNKIPFRARKWCYSSILLILRRLCFQRFSPIFGQSYLSADVPIRGVPFLCGCHARRGLRNLEITLEHDAR